MKRFQVIFASVLILSFLVQNHAAGQNRVLIDVDEIRQQLHQRYLRIEDYQVDLEVSLDMPRLRMPRKRMTFSFKQPDMTRLEAKGFAMVPRRGLVLSPDSILAEMDRLNVRGDTLSDSHYCLVLKGSLSGPEDIPLTANILVDSELWVIREIITFADTSQVMHLSIEYMEVAPDIHLPVETHLQFQLNEQFLRSRGGPRHFNSDDSGLLQLDAQTSQNMRGAATIKFSRYRVNQGIHDSFFNDANPD